MGLFCVLDIIERLVGDDPSEIIRMIFAKLIPEYDYDNQFIENLFDDKRFIQLRQEYRAIYGDYPVAMVEEYKEGISFEPVLFMSEISSSNNVDIDKEIEVFKKNHEKSCAHIEKLLKKLAEKVWRLDRSSPNYFPYRFLPVRWDML